MATTGNDWRDIEPRDKRKWTVMVYMAAGDSSELDSVAVTDLREMEKGANVHTHVVVQINRAWPPLPQRYEITPDNATFVGPAKHRNMASKETLSDFLTWTVTNFPADRYCLVLWGHAFGLGFGRDHNDPLQLKELASALEKFKTARGNDEKLELLGTNACAMSYVEAAYELRESASYLVASQIAVPFAGWPYKTILSRIGETTPQDGETTPKDLGELIVDAYVTHYNAVPGGERVAMTLLNLAAAEDQLPTLLEKLTANIKEEVFPNNKFSSIKLDYVRDTFISTAAGDVRPLIDVEYLCQGFKDADSQSLRHLADEAATRLESLIIYKNAHPDLSDLNGIGIFAPFISDKYDLKRLGLEDTPVAEDEDDPTSKKRTGKQQYQELAICQKVPAWPQLVYDDLRRELPTEVMESLASVGANQPADRRDIAQIVLSIESSFNKLDRIVADARKCVKDDLDQASKNAPTPGGRDGGEAIEKQFGPPWLKLIQPPNLATRVAFLKNLLQAQALEQAAAGEGRMLAAAFPGGGSLSERDFAALAAHMKPARPLPDEVKLVNSVIDFFIRVESAVGDAENVTRRGLTNAKFGLGPTAPGQFNVTASRRLGDIGEEPKSNMGDVGEEPKSNFGATGPSASSSVPSGDLRVDLAFARVVELFQKMGLALQNLEEAALRVETTARDLLMNARAQNLSREDLLRAASEEIDRSFRILEEASAGARRTVRHVLGHPVYGVGPTAGTVGLEERLALASAGGLDRRHLRLL